MSIENAESANPLAQRYIIAWALALVFYFLEYAARSSPAVMIPRYRRRSEQPPSGPRA